MNLKLRKTKTFEKDVKRIVKRGLPIQELTTVINLLINGTPLPANYHDHALIGDYAGFRECHIRPDWLLIYLVSNEKLVLTCMRTGSHSDLF